MKKLTFFLIFVVCLTFVGVSQPFYRTPSGKKFHLGSCKLVEHVSNLITLEEAHNLGLEPCKKCLPNFVDNNPISGPFNAPTGPRPKTEQCHMILKNGNQCKHMTRIGDYYCYEHKPK